MDTAEIIRNFALDGNAVSVKPLGDGFINDTFVAVADSGRRYILQRKNKNIFVEEYQDALTNDIIRCAKDIYIYAWTGNNIYVKPDNGRWPEREQYQRAAIKKCNELLALINMARRLFHLKGKKVRYWSQMTLDTRALLARWHEANAKQYGM